jgi:hypothetical protein
MPSVPMTAGSTGQIFIIWRICCLAFILYLSKTRMQTTITSTAAVSSKPYSSGLNIFYLPNSCRNPAGSLRGTAPPIFKRSRRLEAASTVHENEHWSPDERLRTAVENDYPDGGAHLIFVSEDSKHYATFGAPAFFNLYSTV